MIYTSFKKRKPQKPNAAQRQLAAEWEAMMKKLTTPPGRTTSNHIPSRNTGDGIGYTKEKQYYTGSNMIGIGTLHKSNAVPIFSEDDAKEQARMRRG